MAEEKSPAELFAEFLRVRDEFDYLSDKCGLFMKNADKDIPRSRFLDHETLGKLDQLERRQHELWNAYRARLSA